MDFNPDRLLYTIIQAICIDNYCNSGFDPASGEELWMSDGTDLRDDSMLAQYSVPEDESWESDGTTYCCMDDFQGGASFEIILMKGSAIWFSARVCRLWDVNYTAMA